MADERNNILSLQSYSYHFRNGCGNTEGRPLNTSNGINTTALSSQYKETMFLTVEALLTSQKLYLLIQAGLISLGIQVQIHPNYALSGTKKDFFKKSLSIVFKRASASRQKQDPYTYCPISNSRDLWPPLIKDKAPNSIWMVYIPAIFTHCIFFFGASDLVLTVITHHLIRKSTTNIWSQVGQQEKPQQ